MSCANAEHAPAASTDDTTRVSSGNLGSRDAAGLPAATPNDSAGILCSAISAVTRSGTHPVPALRR